MDFPTIGIVGTGSLAQALGRALHHAGIPVAAVASRSRERAEQAAAFIHQSVAAVDIARLPDSARLIVVATADTRIRLSAESLADVGFAGVALHTCGALGPDVLDSLLPAGAVCGVFHPLQTIARGAIVSLNPFHGVTFGVAGDSTAMSRARELATVLDARTVLVQSDRFAEYHAGAVLASNAIAALLDSAILLFSRAGVDADAALDALAPLVRTAVENALQYGPRSALTGPVVRGDVETVNRHLNALGDAPPRIGHLYRAVSRCLAEIASERGQAPETLEALAAALDVPWQRGRS